MLGKTCVLSNILIFFFFFFASTSMFLGTLEESLNELIVSI